MLITLYNLFSLIVHQPDPENVKQSVHLYVNCTSVHLHAHINSYYKPAWVQAVYRGCDKIRSPQISKKLISA